ncbi:hypothetical protein [Adlercreutzia sp. ZJ138]|uniref:hypothetical protein n=1 Tax=Adlercreutzia sp. ZJ138 TaxID=2709405 RepID=UPI0013EBC9EB|nr:hypothetical protein [Adlercreutzia sp. ZJ138]
MAFGKVRNRLGSAAGNAIEKAKEQGGKAVVVAKEGAFHVADKAQETSFELRKKYYNPLSPEEFFDPEFDLPRLIVIEDEDEKKGVDIFEGTIGWLTTDAGMEVLHLFGVAVENSGISFCPLPSYGAVYYCNGFGNDNRYLRLDRYLDTVREEMMSELKQIAHKLGARECRLESVEESKLVIIRNKKAKGNVRILTDAGRVDGSAEAAFDQENSHTRKRTMLFQQKFEGNAVPQQPELHWYSQNKEILSLIESRLTGSKLNVTSSYCITVECSASSFVTESAAAKIDAALKKNKAAMNFSFAGQILDESRQKMTYEIVF